MQDATDRRKGRQVKQGRTFYGEGHYIDIMTLHQGYETRWLLKTFNINPKNL